MKSHIASMTTPVLSPQRQRQPFVGSPQNGQQKPALASVESSRTRKKDPIDDDSGKPHYKRQHNLRNP